MAGGEFTRWIVKAIISNKSHIASANSTGRRLGRQMGNGLLSGLAIKGVGLYLIEPQGNNERLIYRSNLSSLDSVALFRPAWSPDSKSLVFVDPWGEASVGLVKIQIDEGMPTPINNEELIYWLSAVWSPDGNSLLFSAAKKKDDPFYIDQIPAVFLANLIPRNAVSLTRGASSI